MQEDKGTQQKMKRAVCQRKRFQKIALQTYGPTRRSLQQRRRTIQNSPVCSSSRLEQLSPSSVTSSDIKYLQVTQWPGKTFFYAGFVPLGKRIVILLVVLTQKIIPFRSIQYGDMLMRVRQNSGKINPIFIFNLLYTRRREYTGKSMPCSTLWYQFPDNLPFDDKYVGYLSLEEFSLFRYQFFFRRSHACHDRIQFMGQILLFHDRNE